MDSWLHQVRISCFGEALPRVLATAPCSGVSPTRHHFNPHYSPQTSFPDTCFLANDLLSASGKREVFIGLSGLRSNQSTPTPLPTGTLPPFLLGPQDNHTSQTLDPMLSSYFLGAPFPPYLPRYLCGLQTLPIVLLKTIQGQLCGGASPPT